MNAVKSISFLWLGTICGAGFGFIAQILFARNLSALNYGILASSLVAVTLLGPLASFGIGPFWLRIFGSEGWNARRWLPLSLCVTALGCIVACALLIVFAWLDTTSAGAMMFWLIPLIGALAVSDLVTARLQLEERFSALSLWHMVPQLGRLAVALLLVIRGGTLGTVGFGFLLMSAAILVMGVPMINGMIKGNFKLAGHIKRDTSTEITSPRFIEIVSGSWPFAAAGIFYLIYFQSDILLLKWMRDPEAAGMYNVAYSMMAAAYMLPGVVYQKYLQPKQHRWAEHDHQRFLAVFRFGCGVMLTVGIVVMIMFLIMGPWIIPLLFGQPYARAGQIILLLAVCVPMRFLATSVGGTLVTKDHMRHKVRYMGIAAGANVVLNLLLIPFFSYFGAAAATVASEMIILCLYLVAVKKRVFGDDAWRGWTLRQGIIRDGR